MASTFFISKSAFARTERCIVFHIPADRRVRVLSMDLTTKPMESPINPPIIKEMAGTFIRGNSAIPFLSTAPIKWPLPLSACKLKPNSWRAL